MEIGVAERKFVNAYIVDIMVKFGLIQFFTFSVVDFLSVDYFYYVILFLVEEILYLFFVIKEAKIIIKYNFLLKKGDLILGKCMPWIEEKCVIDNRFETVYEIKIICKHSDNYYKGKLRFSGTAEKKDHLLQLLAGSEIPILIDKKIYYVMADEFAEKYNYQKDYNALLVLGIILRIINGFVFFWILHNIL